MYRIILNYLVYIIILYLLIVKSKNENCFPLLSMYRVRIHVFNIMLYLAVRLVHNLFLAMEFTLILLKQCITDYIIVCYIIDCFIFFMGPVLLIVPTIDCSIDCFVMIVLLTVSLIVSLIFIDFSSSYESDEGSTVSTCNPNTLILPFRNDLL